MRKLICLVILGMICLVAGQAMSQSAEECKTFVIYKDGGYFGNHYFPSGWMGDYLDITLDEQNTQSPYEGSTAIKLSYSASGSQGNDWAGIYWQNPPNNWGDKQGGFDLTGFNKLSFWAKGEKGGEVIDVVKVGGIDGAYPDSVEVSAGPMQLTGDWKEYSINLIEEDLSYISGGFCIVLTRLQNADGAVIYMDKITYEYDPKLQVTGKVAQMPFYVYSDYTSLDNHFIPSGWMGDYGDVSISQNSKEEPQSGDSCIKVDYSAKATQGAGWAGIYWQNPANNWGNKEGAGFDFSSASKLTFWAKGAKGDEQIAEFKIGGIMGEYPDSDYCLIGPVTLTPEWKQYTIDLRGKDLTHIIGGFCFSTNRDLNPDGAVFYLDEIRYE